MFGKIYSPSFEKFNGTYRLVSCFLWLPKTLNSGIILGQSYETKWLSRVIYYEKHLPISKCWKEICWCSNTSSDIENLNPNAFN